MQDLHTENFVKEIKEDLSKWKAIQCSWIKKEDRSTTPFKE